MIDRKTIEQREKEFLSPFACRAAESRGRIREEGEGDLRTCFSHDRDRIIHSKSFRRLMHKTQVFLAPEGDHYRTRPTHTLEVAQIARTIARCLALNEDLTEAIALGHDLGHTPFGHAGEQILNEIHPGGFRHNEQSLRVVDLLDDTHGHRGMNLTREVRDGIVNHTGPVVPFTLEGQVVHIADRIAYINHDIDDALRSGIIDESDLPKDCAAVLGNGHSKRIDTLVTDMIRESDGKDAIRMSEACHEAMEELRRFMFREVYLSRQVKGAQEELGVEKVLTFLYEYFTAHPGYLPTHLLACARREAEEEKAVFGIAAKDHVAGMTDRFALNLYEQLR